MNISDRAAIFNKNLQRRAIENGGCGMLTHNRVKNMAPGAGSLAAAIAVTARAM
jgi:hypothetical protein